MINTKANTFTFCSWLYIYY